jgi:hypothetical protein
MEIAMTPEQLALIAGVVVSLVFSYAPVLKDWYDAQTPTPKRLLMLAVLLLSTLGALLWTCRADVAACMAFNWQQYLTAFITAAIASQATFALSPLPPARRTVRAAAFEKHMLAAGVVPPKP